MTRPRVTSNATEALGASISDSKYRLGRLEIASHVHRPDIFVPTGGVMPYAGTSSPSGWLLCYGQVVTIAAYSDLYGIIGAIYNTGGEGAGNFRVPDLRGRVVAGVDNMGGTDAGRLSVANVLGTGAGNENNTHNHYQSVGYDGGTFYAKNFALMPRSKVETVNRGAVVITQSNTPGRFDSTENETISVLQPTYILNYIIKT